MNEQELNKKLAEWAGFKLELNPSPYMGGDPYKFWVDPRGWDGYGTEKCPRLSNFTQSLDACFKWLVPKLTWYQINNRGRDNHHAFVCLKRKEVGSNAETSALALCKAIEKLIDGELTNNIVKEE